MAIVICIVVSVFYVFMGGMKQVIYINIPHSIAKYVGIGVALHFGLTKFGDLSALLANLPPDVFNWTHVGWSQILARLISSMRAIVSTQYVIQAINTTDVARSAKIVRFSTVEFVVPFGIITALVTVRSLAVYPSIPSIKPFSVLISKMDGAMASVVAATLLYKDLYAGMIVNNPSEKNGPSQVRTLSFDSPRCDIERASVSLHRKRPTQQV